MPTGRPPVERATHCAASPGPRRGFTYLWLLFLLAAVSAMAGITAERWTQASRRQMEQEQIFRGQQIAAAIAAYHAASAATGKAWPKALDDLLEDHRFPPPHRYLRRLYADPFTGHPDWMPLADSDGGIHGVRSRSQRAAVIVRDLQLSADGKARVADRVFGEIPGPGASAPPPRQGGRAAHS